MSIKRKPIRFTDTDGVARYSMPLARPGVEVIIDIADLDAIAAAGISLQWSQGADGYPRVNVPGCGTQAIARLILGAQQGERTCYRDGNPLNLRRSNLTIGRVGDTRSKAAALALLLASQAATREEVAA